MTMLSDLRGARFSSGVGALLVALLLFCLPARADAPQLTLFIAGHPVRAELAADPDTRMRGLMFRERMDEDTGMLFVYPEVANQSMWMMNTVIPISVAFVDKTGTIINIEDMEPQTIDVHSSNAPVAYALEMNRGWFAKRGIGRGARVQGLPPAPAPE